MSNQILSVYGLYVYDNSLFDGLKIPEGLDKDTLIDNLLLELGVFETLYPDSDFMKAAIKVWSEKEFRTWDELYKTMLYDYDPIANYDRTENWTIKREGNNVDSGEGSNTSNLTNKTAAFNSPEMTDKESAEGGGTSNFENTQKIDETLTRQGTAKGNIGVTTTQQMIEAQRDVVKFNVYNFIIDSFKSRFCIMVY